MLTIVRQPESKHRARYISEGSRGSIKDHTGLSFPAVQVTGKGGSDGEERRGSGRRARETTDNGIPVLEFTVGPQDDMVSVLDCVGILKICSGDVRAITGMKWAKGSIRLAICASLPSREDGGPKRLLHTLSTPIFCGQQLGVPELKRLVPNKASLPLDNDEVFTLVGRNFDKNARVLFHLPGKDGKKPWWTAEGVIHRDYHTCQFHMISVIPAYTGPVSEGAETVRVEVEVVCGEKRSNRVPFFYRPPPPAAPASLPLSPSSSPPDAIQERSPTQPMELSPQLTLSPVKQEPPSSPFDQALELMRRELSARRSISLAQLPPGNLVGMGGPGVWPIFPPPTPPSSSPVSLPTTIDKKFHFDDPGVQKTEPEPLLLPSPTFAVQNCQGLMGVGSESMFGGLSLPTRPASSTPPHSVISTPQGFFKGTF